MARARPGPARLISLFGSPRCPPDRRYSFAREPMQTGRWTQGRPWPRSPPGTRHSVVSRPRRQREEGRASAGRSSLRDEGVIRRGGPKRSLGRRSTRRSGGDGTVKAIARAHARCGARCDPGTMTRLAARNRSSGTTARRSSRPGTFAARSRRLPRRVRSPGRAPRRFG
jgi:hypothetical protein